jgi:hypothetical protein
MSLLPNDQTVVGNLTVAGNIVSFTNTVGTDAYGDLLTTSRTNVLDAHNTFGLTALRDTTTTSDDATVTKPFGAPEFKLAVTAGAGGEATLRTKKRGKYVAGNSADVAIAFRIEGGSATFSAGQECAWGYFDDDDGYSFVYDDTGLNAVITKGGVRTSTVNRVAFNGDQLDGTGPSGHTLDVTAGYMWKISFSSGYNAVLFRIVLNDGFGNQVIQTVHRYVPVGETAVDRLSLPISVALRQSSDAGAEARSAFVGERQYSMIGQVYGFATRTTCPYALSRTIFQTADFVPILSVRRKTGWNGQVIRISSLDVVSNNECVFQVRVLDDFTDLPGAVFGDVPDTVQNETALESDTSATAMTGGVVAFMGIVPFSSVTGRASTTVQHKEFDHPLEDDGQILTIAVKSTLVDTARVSVILRLSEEW